MMWFGIHLGFFSYFAFSDAWLVFSNVFYCLVAREHPSTRSIMAADPTSLSEAPFYKLSGSNAKHGLLLVDWLHDFTCSRS